MCSKRHSRNSQLSVPNFDGGVERCRPRLETAVRAVYSRVSVLQVHFHVSLNTNTLKITGYSPISTQICCAQLQNCLIGKYPLRIGYFENTPHPPHQGSSNAVERQATRLQSHSFCATCVLLMFKSLIYNFLSSIILKIKASASLISLLASNGCLSLISTRDF